MMPIAIPVLLHLGASHCPRSCNAFTCDRRWCRACCACGGNCTLPAPEPPRPPVDQEHALLEILLESLTAMHAQHAPDLKKRSGVALGEFWLRNRAWEGGGHIGNRPAQASAYYDLVRAERERLADVWVFDAQRRPAIAEGGGGFRHPADDGDDGRREEAPGAAPVGRPRLGRRRRRAAA